METNNKEIKRRNTFSLLFYINRTKVREGGTCKPLCKVSIGAKPVPINISAFADLSPWNPEAKRVDGQNENARAISLAIERLTEKIAGHYRHIRRSLGSMTTELVKNAVEGIGRRPLTLLVLFHKHNEEFHKRIGVDRKEETYESYENSYNILAPFVKKGKEKEDVVLRSLDREFCDDFEILLRTDHEIEPKTVYEHLYWLKKVIKRAVGQGTFRRDPYEKLHPGLSWRKSRHLELEDLKKLMETPVDKPNLQRVRDWFLFTILTGLSYTDLRRLSEKGITQLSDGTYWIHIRRQKTETPLAIRLLNVPLQIIEKYRYERKSDRTSNLYYRGYLIKLTRGLGRTYGFDMTSHKARHNLGTYITLSLGMPIETVSRMMGHKSISTVQIYARVTGREVDEDMKRLKEQTKGRKVNLYGEDEPEMTDIITVNG